MEKNILIAEANDRQRLKITKAVSAVAAKAGVSVKIYKAVNAVRAMRILEKNNIDILILNTGYRKTDRKIYQESAWWKNFVREKNICCFRLFS